MSHFKAVLMTPISVHLLTITNNITTRITIATTSTIIITTTTSINPLESRVLKIVTIE